MTTPDVRTMLGVMAVLDGPRPKPARLPLRVYVRAVLALTLDILRGKSR